MDLVSQIWAGNNLKSHPLNKIATGEWKSSNLSKFRKLKGVEKTKSVIEFLNSEAPFENFQALQKASSISAELRTKGNELYKEKKFKEALRAYNLAICFSPNDSPEFLLAVANRSALFFHLGEYDICKADLQLVFQSEIQSEEIAHLKGKLQNRFEKCSLQSPISKEAVDRKDVLEYFSLKNPSEKILSSENFISVKTNPDRGRHVVLEKSVPPGTLLIVEDPFAKVLLEQFRWDVNHCHTCLHPISNGVPCKSCVFEIFCSPACQAAHDVHLCQISSHLHAINPSRNLLLATKVVTSQGLDKLIEAYENPPVSDEEPIGFANGIYASDSYRTIYNLIFHETNSAELFQYTLDAALVTEVLWRFSNLFDARKEDQGFKIFICQLINRHLRNFPPNAHSINELVDLNLVEYGAGAYALLSLINHSCDPNVTRFNLPNGRVAVVTVKSIEGGGELLDNYGVHYAINEFLERQKHLTKHYYFNCDCVPCMKNWPLYKELKFRDQISMFNVYGFNVIASKFEVLFDKVMKDQDIQLSELLECLAFFEVNFQLPFSKFNEAQETFKHYMNATIRKVFGRNRNL